MSKLSTLFGTQCVAKIGDESFEALIFDFANLTERQQFLNDIFGDCAVPGDFSDWLGGNKDTIEWIHETEVPFAFISVTGTYAPGEFTFPSGDAIPPELRMMWVTDPSIDGPVYSIEVPGPAVPAERGELIAARRSLITFEPVEI